MDPVENQPPSISGSQSCSQTGSGGWCVGTLTLNLSASDPQGQTVLISGDVNGTQFACANGATSCAVPLPEGSGVVNYTVTSATGLRAGGSQGYQRDATSPQINGTLSGTSGDNGWFVSDVDASASASDAVSGVTSFSYSLDGGTWASYDGSTFSLSDGEHTLEFRAQNAAGLQNETTQTVKIDTLTPDLELSLTGTSGSNGWYRSDVGAAASASDSGSGLEDLQYQLDGAAWTDYLNALTLTDGVHTLDVIATDAAGNETPLSQEIKVDTLTPLINLSVTGTTGANGWFVSNIQVGASASDAGSGVDAFEYSIDNGAWIAYTTSLSYTDSQRSLKFRATDEAGNVTTTPAQPYGVDSVPPVIDMPAAWNLGQTVDYEVQDTQSGVGAVRIVIEDDLERFPKLSWYDAAVSEIPWDGRFRDGTRAPDGEYLVTLKATDQAGNESITTAIVTVDNNLFTLFIPPFNPPADTPAPPQNSEPVGSGNNFGGENNDDGSIPVTGFFSAGGLTSVAGTSGTVSFSSQSPSDSPVTNLPNSDILWGAAAAVAIGAFNAEILRKKQEEAAAAAERAAHRKGKKDKGPLSYKQIAAAYQASLNNFKAALKNAQAAGMSTAQADALRSQVAQEGKIGGALGAVQSYVAPRPAGKVDAAPTPIQVMPPGLSPEAQQAYLHGGSGAAAWINHNAAQLQEQHALDVARQQANIAAKKQQAAQTQTAEEKPPEPSTSLASRLENWLTSLALNGPIIELAKENEVLQRGVLWYTSVVGDSLRSIGDPDRNPRMAAGSQQMWDGINAWQGIFDMRADARNYTVDALKEGRWSDAWSGTQALVKQNLEMTKYTAIATGMAVWGIVTTPVRIFTHDIPEFYNAGKERMEGKDRFWDVLLTGTNLAGDVSATYAIAKPVGLLDRANMKLSETLFGKAVPDKFVPYYLKDTFLNGGANRALLNNLVDSSNAMPSTAMTAALKLQSFYQQMLKINEEIQAGIPKVKPIQAVTDFETIYRMAAEAEPELRSTITTLAEKTNGQAQFSSGLKEVGRALQKINADYEGNASRITDIARGRVVYQTLEDLY
ncbi:MAG TPA: Ig-like domain repeat protein, partial [Anaerolineales bacterium]